MTPYKWGGELKVNNLLHFLVLDTLFSEVFGGEEGEEKKCAQKPLA